MGLTLYQLAADHRRLFDTLMETQDDPRAIADTLESESGALEVKVVSAAYVIKTLEAEAEAIEAAVKEMQSRAKSRRNHVERLKSYVASGMEMAQITAIKGEHFDVKISDNAESVEIYDAEMLPEIFLRLPTPAPEPDKTAIRDALKKGFDVQGARLIRTKRLTIK